MPMHDSTRDQVLHAMSRDGWANESDGNVESPWGFFSRISNSTEELPEIVQAFSEIISEFPAATLSGGFDTSELVGHFLLVENNQGQIFVTEFDSEQELQREFDGLTDVYSEWCDD